MRLLAAVPHPDDESYAMGGLLALCAQGGAQIRVLSATRGEAGSARAMAIEPGPELAALRTREMEQSCTILGVSELHFLGCADGELEYADLDPFLGYHLNDFDPQVVVTLGVDGAYGHRDHVALTLAVTRALRRRNLRLLHTAFARGLFANTHRTLSRWRRDLIHPNVRRASLGIDRDQVDLCLCLDGVRAQKQAAIAAHNSQLTDGDYRSFLEPGLVDALMQEEWFTVARGPALPSNARHPFEGLSA